MTPQTRFDGNQQRKPLIKSQRRRIWRILKPGNWPINHFGRDGMDQLFAEEIKLMNQLREKILKKAVHEYGYDPEEDLVQ